MSPIAGVTAAVLGALGLIGWLLDVELLRSFLRGGVAMNPLGALASMLAGASLVLLSIPANERQRRIGRACALVVLAAGFLRLVGYTLGHDVGIDAWLFRSRLGSNRLAPNTAFNFLFIGLALATLDVRTRRDLSIGQLIILTPAGVSLVALAGYAYGVPSFYRVAAYIPMALNSALALAILCLGIVCARPQWEPMATVASDTAGGTMARRLLPAAVAIPLVLGWLRLHGERAGLYATEFGVSLMVVASILTFGMLIWWTSRALHGVDLTRRRAEQALRASEERARRIVDSAYDAFIGMNADGVITAWNPQAERIFGWSRQEAIGRVLAETIIPPRYREAHRGGLRRFQETGEGPVLNRRIELTALHRDGREIPVELTISAIPVDATHLFAAFVHDISERKRAETQLQEQNVLLNAAVRSERDAHESLKRAQSILVQREKLASVGQMVAGVAHEINNPLAFVMNNLAVLQRDAGALRELVALYREMEAPLATVDPALVDRLRAAGERIDVSYTLGNLDQLLGRSREGLRRIAKIVKDLRGFARLDEGERHHADLNPGVESTVNVVQGHAARKGVVVRMELAQLPPVPCNPAKINQVVLNLITNAIDACAKNGAVTVRTSADSRCVRIDVIDTGPGIDPAIQDRIFDPFFTTKPVGEGTGLGLSISYGIAEEHGGSIEVDSTPGDGARFTLRLPLPA